MRPHFLLLLKQIFKKLQEEDRAERVGRSLIDVLEANRDKFLMEHNETAATFKVKTSETSKFK